MSRRVWIRLDLPDHEMLSLRESIPECEYLQGTNVESDERLLASIDVVFTEAPLPENLTTRMPNLKWLHVTCGGVSAYLTSDIKRAVDPRNRFQGHSRRGFLGIRPGEHFCIG